MSEVQVLNEVNALRGRVDKIESNLVRPRSWGEYVAIIAHLPGIRGAWNMGRMDVTGNALDITGLGLSLTRNGNPLFNIANSIVSYLDLDGTGDFLSRPTEAGFEIIGTEAIYASGVRGLTMGGWFWTDISATDQNLMGKWTEAGNLRAYTLNITSANALGGHVSLDGAAQTSVGSSGVITTGKLFWAALRFTPAVELANWLNETKTANTTSIPASIFNSSAAFQIGARNAGAFLLNGRTVVGFLSANVLPDGVMSYLYRYGKALLHA